MATIRTTTPERSRVILAVELALWALCVIALGLATWMKVDALAYQTLHARDVVVQARMESSTERAPHPAVGAPIAFLELPRLDLSVVVAEGATEDVLRRAAGRLPSSAAPGEPGNVVIAGHRDTFFRPLERVRRGDLVLLDSPTGRQAYRVEWFRVVEPHDLSVLESRRESELTLVTCYPFRYIGSAPERFVVRARSVD